MNHYHTSDGERVAKSVIDSRVREAKSNALSEQFWEFGYNFCTDCLTSNGRLKVRCRDCHIKHDSQSRINES